MPEVLDAFIPLLEILAFLGALILVVVAYGIIDFGLFILSKTVGFIPFVGPAIANFAREGQVRITGYASGVVQPLEARIARNWHAFAHIFYEVVATIELTAQVVWYMVRILNPAGFRQIISGDVAFYRSLFVSSSPQSVAIDREIHTIDVRLKRLQAEVQSPATRKLEARLKAQLAHLAALHVASEPWVLGEIDSVVNPSLQALRDRATALEDSAIQVYRDAAGVYHAVNIDTLVAAVAIALPKLGLDWLRCRGMSRFFSRTGCGLGNLMETLLGDAFIAFAVTDICEFSHLAEEVALELKPALFDLVDAAEALVGCHGATLPGSLGVPALPALTVGAGLSLAGV